MNPLNALYYKIYKFQVSVGNESIAHFATMIFLGIFLALLFFDFIFISDFAFSVKFNLGDKKSFFLVYSLLFLIIIIYYSHKKKYLSTIKNYEQKYGVKNNNFFDFIILFSPFIILILCFYIAFKRNN